MSTPTTDDVRQRLHDVEGWIARLDAELRKLHGQRDALLLALSDFDGAHDTRPTAVR